MVGQNHRVRWVGRDPWRSGIWLCPKAWDGGRSIGEVHVAMVNGEFESPEMSLLRCPVNDCLTLHRHHRDHPQE